MIASRKNTRSPNSRIGRFQLLPVLLRSAVFPSSPTLKREMRSAAAIGSHAIMGSLSSRGMPSFASSELFIALIAALTSLTADSATPLAFESPTGTSLGTASTPASSAAFVFSAISALSPSDMFKIFLYPRRLITPDMNFTAYVSCPFAGT